MTGEVVGDNEGAGLDTNLDKPLLTVRVCSCCCLERNLVMKWLLNR